MHFKVAGFPADRANWVWIALQHRGDLHFPLQQWSDDRNLLSFLVSLVFTSLVPKSPPSYTVHMSACLQPEQYHLNNSAYGPFGQGLPHAHSNHSAVGLNKYTSLKAVGKLAARTHKYTHTRWESDCKRPCDLSSRGRRPCSSSHLVTQQQQRLSCSVLVWWFPERDRAFFLHSWSNYIRLETESHSTFILCRLNIVL